MADRLSDAWFDELLSRVSIQEVVGRYVTLTKKGRKLWACCPFHSEKTPSFSVDEEKGLYYCFGCHKGGNAITFLSEYERIDKFEAIKMLADMARMEVPENHADPERAAREKELQTQIYEANLFAARFFHNLIWKPEGAQALKYLYARGLTDADIAALMQRAYNTVNERNSKLRRIFGCKSTISVTLQAIANKTKTSDYQVVS